MTELMIVVVALGALALAVGLAFVPLQVLMNTIAKNVAAPIRQFIERRRERRAAARNTPDRRKTAA